MFWVPYMHLFCIFVFAPVQLQLSMFHKDRRSKNVLIIIIIIITCYEDQHSNIQFTLIK